MSVRELPIPELREDDALMRVEACGLCGTDYEQWAGDIPAPTPFVPGHETVGVIDAIGPVAAERWGVAKGDRIALEVFQSCGKCSQCKADFSRGCERHGIADVYGQIPLSTEPGIWGGYAEYQYLAPDSQFQKVPEGLDPVVACAFNAVAGGLRWGTIVPEVKPGDVVAILGPGIRGLSAAAAAREAGAEFVMVTGRGDRDRQRLEAAKAFGADLTVDVARRDPIEALDTAIGRAADVVVDVTANSPEAFGQAVELAALFGRIVCAGMRGDHGAPGFEPDRIVTKQLKILGAMGVDRAQYRQAVELLASGHFPFESLPRRVADLDTLGDLFACMRGETDETPPVHGVLVP